MGMHQVQTRPRTTTSFKSVRTRLYPSDHPKPLFVATCYREDVSQPGQRYLDVLDTLSDARTQPYIHDVVVTVTYRRKTYKFRVFFKRHKLLAPNQSIRALAHVDVRGDVLLAAVGNTADIRNLRGGDECRAADLAVKRLMQSPIRNKRRIPETIAL